MMPGRAQRIVEVLAAADGCLTLDQIDIETETPRHHLSSAIGNLISRGAVQRERPGCYRLTDQGRADFEAGKVISSGPCGPHSGQRTPRKPNLRKRLWKALRQSSGRVTILDCLVIASAGNEAAAENNAQRYFRELEAAGFIVRSGRREEGTAPTSNGYVRWLLLPDMNTGPEAPRKSKGRLFDPNTDKYHDLGGGE